MFLHTVVVLIMLISFVPAQEQTPDGSVSFKYYDSEAKAAAEKLEDIFVSVDSSLGQYICQVNTSNNALTALLTYVEAEASAKGTACYIGGQDEKRFDNAPQNITRALKTCDTFVPLEDRETLKNAIVEALKKIQTYDDNIRFNAIACFSLRVPPSQGCIDSETKARDGIKSVIAIAEIDKYQTLKEAFLAKAKKFIDSCFSASTKQLVDQLASWTKQIKDCQASLKQ